MIILRRVGSDLSSGLLYECMGLPSLPQARTVGGGRDYSDDEGGRPKPPSSYHRRYSSDGQSVSQPVSHPQQTHEPARRPLASACLS